MRSVLAEANSDGSPLQIVDPSPMSGRTQHVPALFPRPRCVDPSASRYPRWIRDWTNPLSVQGQVNQFVCRHGSIRCPVSRAHSLHRAARVEAVARSVPTVGKGRQVCARCCEKHASHTSHTSHATLAFGAKAVNQIRRTARYRAISLRKKKRRLWKKCAQGRDGCCANDNKRVFKVITTAWKQQSNIEYTYGRACQKNGVRIFHDHRRLEICLSIPVDASKTHC